MNRFVKTCAYTTAAVAAVLFTQTVSFADEVKQSSVTTSTPLGSASTSVSSRSNGVGTATRVDKSSSTLGANEHESYKAEAGPDGAKVSKTNTSVQDNGDGSVSANRSHESHVMTPAGSAHHTSNASTTLNPDGSTSSVKQSATTATNP